MTSWLILAGLAAALAVGSRWLGPLLWKRPVTTPFMWRLARRRWRWLPPDLAVWLVCADCNGYARLAVDADVEDVLDGVDLPPARCGPCRKAWLASLPWGPALSR